MLVAELAGSNWNVAVLGDGAWDEVLLLGMGFRPVWLDSEVLGESRSRKLVMDGEEGPTPEVPYASTPRSPCPVPTDSRFDASRKEALRGGANGPPSPTGRRFCNAGTPDLRLRREVRAATELLRARSESCPTREVVELVSKSASSSCSTLIACWLAERVEVSEREVGNRA